MKNKIIVLLIAISTLACSSQKNKSAQNESKQSEVKMENSEFQIKVDRFADVNVLRYQIPGWDKLSLDQKKLVYYLSQAGYHGRDMIWDQNYKHNLEIRSLLEKIIQDYNGDKNNKDWDNFIIYSKRVFFASGIHHHYSNNKMMPDFSKEYFTQLTKEVGKEVSDEILEAIFNPDLDNKKVNLNPEKDLVLASAINFYDSDISEKEAIEFYKSMIDTTDARPISYGLNSKLVRAEDGSIKEVKWTSEGMYADAIKNMVIWLNKAIEVAENDAQKEALQLLVHYFNTGDLKTWDDYSIAWAKATEGDIDYIIGFIETYYDPLAYKGYYESIIEINDFDASERMKIVAENVQWFEDNSPIMDEHKKANVTGVSYKVVNVASEAGGTSPAGPIGVNLPNANWIRAEHGSKSVSLGNIVAASNNAGGSGILNEFANDDKEKDLCEEYSILASKMKTALHEVVGHASGQLNSGVGTPKETLKNYASTLEEGRSDLVALYYTMDEKLVEMGLIPSLDVAIAQYDDYIRNGLMTQLRRIKLGDDIEEAHMRNRQMVASWAFEKGQADNVIEKITRDGKTYFNINDYEKLRVIFGELLRETQRIKSEGDYEAGRALVENYGVKVDQELHKEVLQRVEKLDIAAYSGYINPDLLLVEDENGNIIDVKVEYPDNFMEQMLDYSNRYSHLMKK